MTSSLRKKVLWVDDEIEYLRSHIMFLETRGYSVTPVFSGDDAIHLITKKPDEFDIVLIDEQMPGKDGLATLAEIKELVPELPVVMVTKSEEEKLMEEALGRKIDGFLTKPVNPSQILLMCKRLLQSHELISNTLKQDFIRAYSANREALQNRLSGDDWVRLYRAIAYWDIQLSQIKDEGIRQAHAGLRSDANALFSEYIIHNYARWVKGEGKPPIFSNKVIDQYVAPLLEKGEQVFFIIIDSMRLDQYLMLQPFLKQLFNIEHFAHFSILPASTEFARNSILSGMYPSQFAEKNSRLWKDILKNVSPSVATESKLHIEKIVSSCSIKESEIAYAKLIDEGEAQKFIDEIDKLKSKKMVTIVVDFVNKLIHGQMKLQVLQDIVPDESAFRSVIASWFERSNLYQILRKLATRKCTVVLTTSNGSVYCTRATELYGGSGDKKGVRFHFGDNITCDERYALFVNEPSRFSLPSKTEHTNYVFLRENYYFVDHDLYQNYNKHYQNSFQQGGISMEEIVVPLAIMRRK